MIAAKLGPGNYRRLADKAGLSKQHVSRALRGIRGMSIAVAAAIADAADVTIDDMWHYIKAQPGFVERRKS